MLNEPDFTPIPPERQTVSDSDTVGGGTIEEPARPLPSKHAMAPRKLVRLLEESASPMYLLDSRDRIRFVNKSLFELLKPLCNDLRTEELLGVECGQRIPSDLHPNREICALLSIPVTATGEYSSSSVVCLPLPHDATQALNQWSSVLVMPLAPNAIGELQSGRNSSDKSADRNSFDRSSFRLCIWIEVESQLAASGSNTSDWQDAGLIQSILFEQRKRYSNLDDFVSLIGISNSARLAMNQLQVAIAVDANCILHGPIGSELQRIAKSILEHRRRRQARSLNAVFTLSVECRLMDRLLMSEMLEIATSHLDPSSRKSDTSSINETQVNLLLDGVETLGVEAIEPLLLFLNRYPRVCVIATADNQLPVIHESPTQFDSIQLDSTQKSSAANRDVRFDLMAAIGVLRVDIPSLQERIEDIPVLAEQILEQIRHTTGAKKARVLSATLRRWLQTYSWPGNYSELHRAMTAAVATSKESQLQTHDLPLAIRTFASHDLKQDALTDLDLDQSLKNYERIILKRALAAHQNNRAAAARSLGITRSRLLRRLEQLSIDAPSPEEYPSNLDLDKASHNKHKLETTNQASSTTRDSADFHADSQTPLPAHNEIAHESAGRSARTASPPAAADRAESHDDPDLPIFESID
ncbi:MAG: hypothetical protein NTW52_17065 [Planctomycetota bacterium]|nr:hypothetical protein [Planctomycetota bacterium]